MPSREERRERNDVSPDDVHRENVPRPAYKRLSRYPVSFAQTKLARTQSILL